jgi:hypothetical protein
MDFPDHRLCLRLGYMFDCVLAKTRAEYIVAEREAFAEIQIIRAGRGHAVGV